MNKELNDKDLEKSSGGSLSTVLDIDSIIALGYTRHEYNEDASNCPSYEADEHFKGQAPHLLKMYLQRIRIILP